MKTKQWMRAVKLSLVILLVVPLLTGCWDRLEIEERAVVLGVSIDTASDESEAEESEVTHTRGSLPPPKKGMVRVGVQIALPGRIPLGPGESGGSQGDSSKTVWVIDVVGHSIDDAFMNLQQQVSSRLFFGHLRVIVVSEAVARKGLENVNDYFRRNSEVRRMAWMMISKGRALSLLKAAPKLERIPTLYLMSTLDEGIRMGKFPKDYIGIFWSNLSKKGQEGFLPYVERKKDQNIEIMGLAYFKGNQMVGSTKPLEIAGYLGLRGVNPAGYRAFINLDGAKETVITYVTQRRSNIDLQIKNDLPHFKVKVDLEVNIEEKINEAMYIDNPQIIEKIEKQQEKASVVFYENIIAKTQDKGSDIFGFGEHVRAKKPGYWSKKIKTKENWQRIYKDATFDISVTVNVRRIGMKAK
ncbi:Ger(x)C family spore germination protein [Paenibacillus arenilitoris]|uniref:Ger(X)C family spore germination protein n=1 Tax=Paenibacillus arenilitoris TaxID=2772299 RepID=A0A927H7V9_9BACL|nr:Ger(x)C family spore germination protein [Paenibacillus arenilitoris]MBD2871430.1 Ger(x)C family spore germination protein [Paenibacillus arenilitoris]